MTAMQQFVLMLVFLLPVSAFAELRVFSCEPEWAALAEEIGGDLVDVYSATTALQDPHYIQARPSLIAKVRRANLVICSGAQLEIGWLPALLQKANNRDVRPGSRGYMEASSFVVRLDATGNVDRAKGDIHPLGNPHVQTNPNNVAVVADVLAKRMAELDAENASIYESRYSNFLLRWHKAIADWEMKAAPLRGVRAITHHKSWVYLEHWLGVVVVGHLEAVPGLPPTATHLSNLTRKFADGGADVIVRSPYQDGKPSRWLAERTGITAIVLPLSVGGTEGAVDLFSLYDEILDRLLGATQ
jgi:zinc/manganese transport system substrate-binding protein